MFTHFNMEFNHQSLIPLDKLTLQQGEIQRKQCK